MPEQRVPELTPKDRLQPSLLDRLTDDERDKSQESREQRVLTLRKLRDAVRRDLTWLLNTVCFGSSDDLSAYPLAARSVLNYGIPDLAGTTASSTELGALERALREAIRVFEPRILDHTVRVSAVLDPAKMSHNALTFAIEGDLYAQPVPLSLYLRTEIDLEAATVKVTESTGRAGPS